MIVYTKWYILFSLLIQILATISSSISCHKNCKTCYHNGANNCESCPKDLSGVYEYYSDFIYDVKIHHIGTICTYCNSQSSNFSLTTNYNFTYNICLWDQGCESTERIRENFVGFEHYECNDRNGDHLVSEHERIKDKVNKSTSFHIGIPNLMIYIIIFICMLLLVIVCVSCYLWKKKQKKMIQTIDAIQTVIVQNTGQISHTKVDSEIVKFMYSPQLP